MLHLQKVKVVLFLTLIAGAPLFAQVPENAQKMEQTTDVSDANLQKFANAYQEIQLENSKAQQQMMSVIQKEGLDVKRFGEIKNASMDPNSSVELSEKEKTQYDRANANLEKMKTSFQQKMDDIIKSKGLSTEKFDQIFLAVQNNKDLQQKVQNLLMKAK